MMRKSVGTVLVAVLILAVSAGAMAQPNRQGRAQNQFAAQAAQAVTLQGVVEAVRMAYGQGMPSFTLRLANGGTATVVLGPYWALADKAFSLGEGESVTVKAFQSPRSEGTYVALEVTDQSGKTTVLRDQAAMPYGRRGGRGFGAGAGACLRTGEPQLDLAAKTSLEGTVESVQMVRGEGFPNVVLLLNGGGKATVVVSPYRVFVAAGSPIEANDRLSVLAYPSKVHENAYVAAEVKNLTRGTVVQLRGEDGLPLGMGGPGRGMCLGPAN